MSAVDAGCRERAHTMNVNALNPRPVMLSKDQDERIVIVLCVLCYGKVSGWIIRASLCTSFRPRLKLP